ncbi:MAG: hypothetical protein ABIJ65_03040, partial [Chloroflexota bacterium]
MFKKTIFVTMVLVLALSACAPSEVSTDDMLEPHPTSTVEKMESTTDAILGQPTNVPEMQGDQMTDRPAWFGLTLKNVRTGEDFSINDFNGKVVLVENLAMWCSNCKKQQIQVKAFLETLGIKEDLVFIGLDIDPNENAGDLKTYTDNNGFSWVYAIAPIEVAREI